MYTHILLLELLFSFFRSEAIKRMEGTKKKQKTFEGGITCFLWLSLQFSPSIYWYEKISTIITHLTHSPVSYPTAAQLFLFDQVGKVRLIKWFFFFYFISIIIISICLYFLFAEPLIVIFFLCYYYHYYCYSYYRSFCSCCCCCL